MYVLSVTKAIGHASERIFTIRAVEAVQYV
jgi:hypothetical protein